MRPPEPIPVPVSSSALILRDDGYAKIKSSTPRLAPPPKTLARSALALLVLGLIVVDASRAYGYGGGSAVTGAEGRSRGSWAALLAGYIALGAITTGTAYFLRENFFGRSVATTAAGWGGLTLGAGAGYGLAQLRTCGADDSGASSAAAALDCSDAQQVATAVGGVVGALAGSIAGHFLTGDPGMSRPYVTAAGLAPALVFLSVGTLTDW